MGSSYPLSLAKTGTIITPSYINDICQVPSYVCLMIRLIQNRDELKKTHSNMVVLPGLSSLFCEDFNVRCFVAI